MSGSNIDRHLGRRLREARTQRDHSQNALAAMLEIDVAVVAAMEAGEARVASLILARASRILDFPLSWFFEGLPGQDVLESPNRVRRSV